MLSQPFALCQLNTGLEAILYPPSYQESLTAANSYQETAEKLETQTAVKKNWMSYGFDFDNEQDDRNAMHATFFFSVTCCLVFGSFIFAYVPDFQLRDWAQREAFLELRRREHLGLPPIDKNLIDPEKIVLPTDEELGDTEIII
uniref:NADH dehydrogenase [ubiquinone] 1 beta subcomplex subunit 11, mitochondrial n=3 Tax=Timema TaxID=61471 RepID=A0A7R8ZA88_TIMDO|nr:unnamed protein product [Timema douglasi]